MKRLFLRCPELALQAVSVRVCYCVYKHICLAKAMGNGPTVWMAKPREVMPGIGFVELLGQGMSGWGFVHTNGIGKAAKYDVTDLHHEILPNRTARIRQSVLETGAGRVQ